MNEVEKLYKNAGIKPTYTDECQMVGSYYSMEKDLNERGLLFDDYMKQKCPNKNKMCYETCPYAYNKEFYPPFTAEKQIELVKWLAKNEMLCRLESEYPYFEKFEECTAYIINYLWQDLTKEEKAQIRDILK